jgi:MFS transporter, CP family, cyanate transporter
MRQTRIDPAILIVLSGIVAALHIGKMPVAIPMLRESLGIDMVEAGFLLAAVQFAGMVAGVLMGSAAESFGLRRSLICGQVLLAIAGFGGALLEQPGCLLAFRALEGLGFLLSVLAAPALIRQLVPLGRLSLYLSFWGTYMPTGAALALLSGPLMMQLIGWRGWWFALSSISAAMALWVWQSVPASPIQPKVWEADFLDLWWRRLHLTLSNKAPWCVALAFAMYSSQWLAVIGFLPSIYEQAGFGKNLTGVLTAIACVSNVLGNLAAGRFLHRSYRAKSLLYFGYLAMAFSTVLAFGSLTVEFPFLRYGAVVVFSAIGGLVPGVLFSLVIRAAPSEQTVSTTVGWMQQCSSTGQFLAPPGIAYLASMAGGWHLTWMATVTASVIGIVFVSMLEIDRVR